MEILRGVVVQVAYLLRPVVLPVIGPVYALEVLDEGRERRRFVSLERPDVLDATGQPMVLAAELAPGSVVNVQADGPALLCVQVVAMKTRNPFDETLTE